MNILVIDDSPLHQKSACQTLSGHDLRIVGTYDEAFELLQEPDREFRRAVREELERDGYQFPGDSASHEEKIACWKEMGRKRRQITIPTPTFDVVLTDLLMPASKRVMAGEGLKYIGEESPVGFGLVLMAVQCGARFAAVVTDTDHHYHPASAMLDPFAARCPNSGLPFGDPPRFNMNRTIVGFYHSPLCPVDGTTCPDCSGTGSEETCYCIERNSGSIKSDCTNCNGTGRYCWKCSSTGKATGKNWGAVLAHLLES